MATTIPLLTVIVDPSGGWCSLIHAFVLKASLSRSNKEMQTDNELVRTDFCWESSIACWSNLRMKLHTNTYKWHCNTIARAEVHMLYIIVEYVRKWYLGLQILVASPGGASLVIAQRVSSALTCTSRESCTHHAQRNWLVTPHRSYFHSD